MPTVNICAHQDDDLYFMSPDVLYDVASAGTTIAAGSIYITAGDGGGGWGTYAQGREAGAKAAWAQMAGVGSPTWTDTTTTLAGKTVATSTLGGTQIRLIFLRLRDGGYGTEGSDPHYLEGLHDGSRSTLTAADSSATYTKAELIATLVAAIGLYGATTVRHHNELSPYGDYYDHHDHTAAGHFAADAVAACTVPPAHVGYLGYRGSALGENVSSGDQTAKRAAFAAYAPYDTALSGTSWDNAWIPRQRKAGPYPTGTSTGTTRRILTSGDDSSLGTNADATATVVAMPFSVSADSLLTAITVMIPSGQNVAVTSQPVTAHLWTSGPTNSTPTYPDTYLGSTASLTLVRGTRNVLTLTTPIKLTAGQQYWAAMHFPAGYYPRTAGKFSSAGATSTDGRVSTPANGTLVNNQYSQTIISYFGAGASPPIATFGAPWYGLDVMVADLTAQYPTAGTAAAVSAAGGSVTVRLAAAAAAVSVSVATGALTSLLPAAGSAVALSAASGTVGRLQPSDGTSASTSASTGSAGLIQAASGTAASTSASQGTANLLAGAQGAAASTSSASGSLTASLTASGTATAVSTASGTADPVGSMAGTASSTSTATGSVTVLRPASGATAATSSASGDLRARLAATGTAAATSTASGSADPASSLSGTATATATSAASGTITLRATASGTVIATSTAAGEVRARLAAAGSVQAVSGSGGTVGVALSASGTAVATSTSAGRADPANALRDLTIHTGAASYTRIIPGPTARRTIHPGRTL